MSGAELTERIKQIALDVGFSKVGITSAEPFHACERPFDRVAQRRNAWLHELYGAQSGETARSPAILPSAKSILSLALNYYTPTEHDKDHLKISRYAWGTDYHEIMPAMLAELLEQIKLLAPAVEGRYYVDTGPVMEKAVADRAGVGWIGKHTNVITREFGSWVFLAEIFLNLDLIADTPAEDLCGTCTKCLDACPTNAIVQPYVVDARKCISYLTIELKPDNPIPSELASNFEGWLYGCDICQDVCPWNRFEQPTKEARFEARPGNLELDIPAIEAMTQEAFSERFRKSPVKRTKLAGLKRNAKVLSNAKSS